MGFWKTAGEFIGGIANEGFKEISEMAAAKEKLKDKSDRELKEIIDSWFASSVDKKVARFILKERGY